MIAIAVMIGVASAVAIIFAMTQSGMLAERSGAAMLLAAIAAFYPVFAVIAADPLAIVLHIGVFVAFAALALRGFRTGLHIIAGGLIAHGFFDIIIGVVHITGPAWWPAFCAGVAITAGILLIRLIQNGKITP